LSGHWPAFPLPDEGLIAEGYLVDLAAFRQEIR
jgi:hypothetical protein